MKMKKILNLLVFVSLIMSGCSKDDEVSFEEQLAIDKALIDEYLEDNTIDAQVHESGIRYVVTEEGEGDSPASGDVVVVKFQGRFLDDEMFTESKYGATFDLDATLIDAWQIMVPELKEGGKITFYAPSGYCFGRGGNSIIPPNSVLVFDIELISIIDGAPEQFTADTTIIDEFLLDKGLSAIVHPTGIRYITEVEGTGDTPIRSDKVRVAYAGSFLEGGTFDQSVDGTTFDLPNLIEAWQIIIPEMKEGGKVTIYSPSKYCYGTNGNRPIILPNTILVFEIELLSIQ